MNCPKCQSAKVKKFGCYGKRRIQRYRCLACKATFSERQPKPLGTHYISVEKATQIISLMVEGVSLRAIARLTDTDLMFHTDSVDEAYDWLVLQLAEKSLAQPGATL